MHGKTERIHFGLVFAGLVFLFNPVVQLHDILPDALGMLLVYFGLKKVSAVNGYFEDARSLSLYLTGLYAIKLAFSFSLFGYPENALPYTFISSVLEIILVCAFFKKLYKGFEYTTMRSENGSTHPTGEAITMASLFTCVKCIVTFLPEMLEFMKQNEEIDLSANASYTMSIGVLKPYAIALSIFIQLVLGIVFLVQTRKFFKSIAKDKAYLDELSEKYGAELEANRHKYVNKTLSVSIYLFIAAMIFMADVNIEGIDILPDVLAAVFLALAVLAVKNLAPIGASTKVVCILSVASGFACTIFSAYVKPELFELLSGEKSFFENHSNGFFVSGRNSALYAACALVFSLLMICLTACFLKHHMKAYKLEMLGNHDRKLLTVFVLPSVCMLTKSAGTFFSASAAHLATNPVVAKFISARPRMTEQHMADEIAANSLIAQFDNVDSFATVCMYAVIVIAVFAVFNGYALKAETVREE